MIVDGIAVVFSSV